MQGTIRIYLFTANDNNIVWTSDHDEFMRQTDHKDYDYKGYIDADKNLGVISGGLQIAPFIGSNRP